MKTYFRTSLAVLAIVGANTMLTVGVSADQSSDTAATRGVTEAMNASADAWNRGDLDGFMTGYLNSPKTSYISGCTEVWGYQALRDRYEKRFGSNHESMGKLTFSDLKIFDLGKSHALCIGHWHLERASASPSGGVYSLVLVKTKVGWKVIHDHTSPTDQSK
jgi:ketosteroid isomerase-like protein